MISLILLIIASIFNAIMDTLKDHFSVSIFKNLNPDFWNPSISWNRKTFLTYRFDAWHIAKSIMIILICFSIAIVLHITKYLLLDIIILGMSWNIFFELFWSKILKNKNKN